MKLPIAPGAVPIVSNGFIIPIKIRERYSIIKKIYIRGIKFW